MAKMTRPVAGLTVVGVLGGVSYIITLFLRVPSGMDAEIKFVAVVAAVAGSIIATWLRNSIKEPYLILAVVAVLVIFLLSFFGYLQLSSGSAGCDSLFCLPNILLVCTAAMFISFSFIFALAGVKWLSPSTGQGPGASETTEGDENSEQ